MRSLFFLWLPVDKMKIKIATEAFDPWQALQQFQNLAKKMRGKVGATSVFVGTMRDMNVGESVKSMRLEHYAGMTEKQLQHIMDKATKKWQIIDALVIHRVGHIVPDDPIVLVAVWSAHRGDAFASSRYIMEALKSTVPFWKKELLASAEQRWVTNETATKTSILITETDKM